MGEKERERAREHNANIVCHTQQAGRSWKSVSKSVGKVGDSGSCFMGAMVGTSARLFPDAEWDIGSQTLVIRCCAHVRQGQVTS